MAAGRMLVEGMVLVLSMTTLLGCGGQWSVIANGHNVTRNGHSALDHKTSEVLECSGGKVEIYCGGPDEAEAQVELVCKSHQACKHAVHARKKEILLENGAPFAIGNGSTCPAGYLRASDHLTCMSAAFALNLRLDEAAVFNKRCWANSNDAPSGCYAHDSRGCFNVGTNDSAEIEGFDSICVRANSENWERSFDTLLSCLASNVKWLSMPTRLSYHVAGCSTQPNKCDLIDFDLNSSKLCFQ